MIIKEIPIFERPREKVINQGVHYLSNTELLAILLRTGTKEENVLRISEKLLYKLTNINDLNDLTINELTSVKGIGLSKAVTVLAAVELGRRMTNLTKKDLSLTSSKQVYEYMKNYFLSVKEEHLYGIYLNAKGGLINTIELSKGTINSTLIDPDLIFKWYYKLSSSAVILVHNHPSGDSTPSIPDLKKTDEVIKKAKLLDIRVLDHIIIGKDYYSMRENNKIFNIFKN
jgi:DNA repair protein RadC